MNMHDDATYESLDEIRFSPSEQAENDLKQFSFMSEEEFNKVCYEKFSISMKQLKRVREQQLEIEDNYDKELKQIMDWREKQLNKLKDHIDYYTTLIRFYAEKKKQEGEKVLTTPWGSCRYRKLPEVWLWLEDDKMIDALCNIPGAQEDGLIKVRYTYDKNAVKRRFKALESGEVIDSQTGCLIEDLKVIKKEDSFSINTESAHEDKTEI